MTEKFGEMVTAALYQAGLNQTEVAEQLGLHPSFISRVARG
ncbi:MAG: hypothetical protein UX78_C0020G0024 [Candidatus Amesbacteria bacterium GW2011_GWA2_47_11]|uniref:HTH cro/C1-type domain-containing protein n=2 Tax=Candidatus Amesiibacteriota TaxID=1752730 RepID=A0A0G1RDR3_9BACT|nr:MAG: hypothetical protein UX78_C0020G0024 [Candidatus Amesbacteria bacterium GW2011_GWA2_47_11]